MKKSLLTAAFAAICVCAGAQTAWEERLDSVVVSSTRAGADTPIAHTDVGRDALRSSNPMNSLPMTLDLLPSVVTYNEGGTGLGNSAITIRGSKGSQINVTLNGITLNDAESQEVFWVNIPALTSLLSGVQVQRGLGTSANGAGAFGASINMNTAFVAPEPSFRSEVSAGSYGTVMTGFSARSGLLPSGLYFDLAWTTGRTDGYIRNAGVRSASVFGVIGWLKGRNSLRFTYLMGDQKSGMTWDGISPEMYALDRTYNGAGEYVDDAGNTRYYPDQTDNYVQHHLQLNYTRGLTDRLHWTTTLDYTRGDGYDEYYKTGRKFAEFGYPFSDVDGVKKSDMIYRKKMGNDLYVLQSSLRYRGAALKVDGGATLSRYDGGHWGEMLWSRVLGKGYDYASMNRDFTWYRNTGLKQEADAFLRAEYRPLPWLTAYADLQYRHIGYDFVGADDKASRIPIDYHEKWNFFNPRGGLTAVFGGHKMYGSVALGHREPGRSDIKENIKGEMIPIKPESMVDVEAGYAYSGMLFSMEANVFLMEYRDMLLETGKLSSSGYAIKENVGRGWRRGLELSAAWTPSRAVRLDGNLTLSRNRLRSFTAYLEDWENGGYKEEHYENTTMLLSPSVVGMGRVALSPLGGWWRPMTLALSGKYVGKQYWDNTQSEDRCIPAFFVTDLSLSHSIPLSFGTLGLSVFVNNLLNRSYYAYAWVYRAWQGGSDPLYVEAGLYPQALRNVMVKASLAF
ncbi:MAG: TonB-dependent receptor [Bacteroidales bacterium]|nr:TonB-dependent receptor [Bacteroidales bacterium]